MKRTATVLTAIVMLIASSAFAMDGDNVSARVSAAFKHDFSQAGKVTWVKNSDFYFASFLLNNVAVDAAYNEAGELVGTSRKISKEQLPLIVSMEISRQFKSAGLTGPVYELTFEGQTNYYLTIQNDHQQINLKCYSNGDIEVERKANR